jgi:uncharacterized phage protein (TIGR01671 family)
MRETKFRVWDILNKEWFDETVCVLGQDGKLIFWDMYNKSFEPLEEKTYIPIFYTGLKDKNGKEIYEGDVFNLGDIRINYEVSFKDDYYGGRQIGNKSRVGLSHWIEKIEIIGNIYENPELLTAKK